jgi:hypothetical protein
VVDHEAPAIRSWKADKLNRLDFENYFQDVQDVRAPRAGDADREAQGAAGGLAGAAAQEHERDHERLHQAGQAGARRGDEAAGGERNEGRLTATGWRRGRDARLLRRANQR